MTCNIMKNRTIKSIAAGAVVIQLAFPVAVLAINEPGSSPEPRGQMKAGVAGRVCESISQMAENAANRYGGQQNKLEERRGNSAGRMADNRNRQENRLNDIRVSHDRRQEERFELLSGKVGNDESGAAVEEFQQAVKAAVLIRRAAFDEALNDFQFAIDVALAERQSAINAAADSLRVAIENAAVKAKADCESGEVELSVIRRSFQDDLRVARDNFRSDMQSLSPPGQVIRDQVRVRQEAFSAAREQFREALESARTELLNKLVENGVIGAEDEANEMPDSE
jgi:hypothetical protein